MVRVKNNENVQQCSILQIKQGRGNLSHLLLFCLALSRRLFLSSAHTRNSMVIFRLGFLVAYGHEEQSGIERLSVREASVEDAVVTNSFEK